MFALVDCQNFYCSCERVFDPALRHRPIAVLSNNDGCIISRSERTKELGIPMGAPFFKWQKKLEKNGVAVRSSNYELYADMSSRVMRILKKSALEQEVYSIDESFLRLPDLSPDELEQLGQSMRQRTRKWTGIPVRVGMGRSKTLAKVANQLAKQHQHDGVFAMPDDMETCSRLLATFPVEKIWGIGPAFSKKLNRHGIETARELRDAPDVWLKRHLTVVGLRTAWELRGVSCLPLELTPDDRKSFVRSRSFANRTEALDDLRQAISKHASRAGEKLREEGLVARGLTAYISTRGLGPGPHRKAAETCELPHLTNDTRDLIRAAQELLRRIYRPGYGYKKAGVVLFDLTAAAPRQTNVFHKETPADRKLMHTVDELNRTMGRDTVVFGGQETAAQQDRPWKMRRQRKSPCYTTRVGEIPVAYAGRGPR